MQTLADAPVWVVCKSPPAERVEALENAGCEVFDLAVRREPCDFDAAMAVLGEKNINYALLEGGSGVLTAAFEAQAVDEVRVFVAPKLVGGAEALTPVAGTGAERMADAIRLAEPKWRIAEDDAMLEALVEYPERTGGE